MVLGNYVIKDMGGSIQMPLEELDQSYCQWQLLVVGIIISIIGTMLVKIKTTMQKKLKLWEL